MPFYLFFFKPFGKLKPTDSIESERKVLSEDYQEFLKVEKSDELNEFIKTEEWILSPEFIKRKKEIQSLQFKGSKEHAQLGEFTKLSKTKAIKQFLLLKDSEKLSRYNTIKNSEKLEEFFKLEEYIKQGEFLNEKKKIKRQVFKGSPEDKKIKEFKRLKKDKTIKASIKAQNNNKADKKIGLSGQEKYKHYLQLEKEIGSDSFIQKKNYLQDKKKFEKSEVYKKSIEYKKLLNDPDIKFFRSFEKSKIYKNYLNIKKSQQLQNYNELKGIINSKDFQDRKTYLEDKKKWDKSEEYKKEQQYLKVKALPHIIKYFKYKGSNDFDFIKNWKVMFEETFGSNQLDVTKWLTCSYWGNKLNGGNYSQPGDLQCFNEGKNIKTDNNRLKIQVKKEKASGKVWNPASGFIPAEFNYTTDTINTGESFWMEDGIIETKIRFNPHKEIASFFYLLGEAISPQINLLEMGVKNRIGAFFLKQGKPEFNGVSIDSLKKGSYYLFSIEKAGNKITWKINEKNVFELSSPDFKLPLHINLANIVVTDVSEAKLPFDFEIEWIRCYQQN